MNHDLRPTWNNVTWGAGGTTQNRSLDLAGRCVAGHWDGTSPLPGLAKVDTVKQQIASIISAPAASSSEEQIPAARPCCLHLTCTNVDQESLDQTLAQARQLGIRNILALRGDPPRGEESWLPTDTRFQTAVDLIRYIRQHHGDYFCIGVAGYPEGHCDSIEQDIERDVQWLKTKQDAGAQFVITQLFYDVDVFLLWLKRCREAGITIPIIPGIMPIQNYQSFRRMTNLCRVKVPPEVLEALEPIRFDDASVKDYGVQLSIRMIARLYLEAGIRGFHLCTLNLEKSVRRVLESLEWVSEPAGHAMMNGSNMIATPSAKTNGSHQPDYPSLTRRALEQASGSSSSQLQPPSMPRSTSSSALPQSTSNPSTWDEFPNGRFGDARSPAFGELDGYGVSLKVPPQDALRIWGHPTSEDDISLIFSKFLLGKLEAIPWCDSEILAETNVIKRWLLQLNLPSYAGSSAKDTVGKGKGWWTVSSQPSVDGIPSSDPTFGFGPKDGYVYQKSFVELFVSQKDKDSIRTKIEQKGKGLISFWAGDRKGNFESNIPETSIVSMTWGLFPGKEIAQPTIIDAESFKAWRDESFAIWSEWELLFPKKSATRELMRGIGEERWLVTVIHHDYKKGEALWEFLLDLDEEKDGRGEQDWEKWEKEVEKEVLAEAPGRS